MALNPTSTPFPLGNFEGTGGPLDAFTRDSTTAVSLFVKIISIIVGIMTVVAIIWFFFTFISGAIGWLGSGGDKTKLQNSQKQITNGLIGLVLVLMATALIKLVGFIFGTPDILSLGFILNLWQ